MTLFEGLIVALSIGLVVFEAIRVVLLALIVEALWEEKNKWTLTTTYSY